MCCEHSYQSYAAPAVSPPLVWPPGSCHHLVLASLILLDDGRRAQRKAGVEIPDLCTSASLLSWRLMPQLCGWKGENCRVDHPGDVPSSSWLCAHHMPGLVLCSSHNQHTVLL